MDKPKILIVGDSAAVHSGFAKQIREIFTPLHMAGKYEIHQLAWWHIDAMEPVPWILHSVKRGLDRTGKTQILKQDAHGEETLKDLLDKIRPDIVWTNSDPWTLKHIAEAKKKFNFIWTGSVYVDGGPLPNEFTEVWNEYDFIVPVTEYGKNVLLAVEGINKTVISKEIISNSANLDIYKPYDKVRRETLRSTLLGQTESFTILKKAFQKDPLCIGFIGRNQTRKMNYCFYHLYSQIWNRVYAICPNCRNPVEAKRLPEARKWISVWEQDSISRCPHCGKMINADAWIKPSANDPSFCMWLHTPPNDRGWRLLPLEEQLGIRGKIIYTHNHKVLNGIPEVNMPDIVNCFDLYLTFADEGFGLPIAEAMACGVPVIAPKHGASQDLTGKVNQDLSWNPATYWYEMSLSIPRPLPNYSEILKLLWKTAEDLPKYSANVLEFISSWVTWKEIAGQWDRTFQDLLVKRREHMNLKNLSLI